MHREKENRIFELWLAAYEEQLIQLKQGKTPRTEEPSEDSSPNGSGPPSEVTAE